MIDKEKPLDIKVGVQTTSDPVYAVNKSGVFGKTSVREPEWPQDATEKQDWNETEKNKSLGAKRFENAKARAIQLGDLPRGLALVSQVAGNSEKDSAMGVVVLPELDMQKRFEERMKSVDGALDQAQNPPRTFPWPEDRLKMTNKNDPGSKKGKTSEKSKPAVETATVVYDGIKKGKPMIEPGEPESADLTVV